MRYGGRKIGNGEARMPDTKPVIHISGAFTAFSDGAAHKSRRRAAFDTYQAVAELIQEVGGAPYDPAHDLDPEKEFSETAAEDIEWLASADGVVACMDERSFGVGAEVMYALLNAKPVLGLAQRGQGVSRLLEGYFQTLRTPETGALYEIFRYEKADYRNVDGFRAAVGPRVRTFVEAVAKTKRRAGG